MLSLAREKWGCMVEEGVVVTVVVVVVVTAQAPTFEGQACLALAWERERALRQCASRQAIQG